MENQELDLQVELRAQETVVFIYRAGHIAAAFLFFLVFMSGKIYPAMLLYVLQGVVHLVKWPPIREELAYRQKIIKFKRRVENLYVFSRSAEEHDDTVTQAFNSTLQLLAEAQNKHEVRVHKAIFQDVEIHTAYIDANGRRHDERTWRDKLSSTEDWEQYLEWREKFFREDKDKRLRQLRSDRSGSLWVEKYILGQRYDEEAN